MKTYVSRWSAILQKLVLIPDQQVLAEKMQGWLAPAKPTIMAFVNAHAMNMAAENEAFANALAGADVILRDGSGMAMLLSAMRAEPGMNMNGTDLIPQLLQGFRGRSIALWGTDEPYLSRAKALLQESLGVETQICITDGFQPVERYVELAKKNPPAIIVLAMGMPKQELVALALREALGQPCLIVCGGAIVDFLAHRFPRAPYWMQRAGMEWVYRLCREPARLFKRYVVGNPLFILRMAAFRLDGALAEVKNS